MTLPPFQPAVETGSAIEDLCRLLYESYGVELICVCQTLYRQDASSFNKQVDLLTKYLKVVLEPIPYVFYRRQRVLAGTLIFSHFERRSS